MSEAAARDLRRLESLKSARNPHERTWRDCFLYVDPIRADGFQTADMSSDQVMAERARLTDSTAIDGIRTLASAIMSGLTPANARWFGLDVGDETDEELRWLGESADLLWQNIHNSNYDAEGYECALDLAGGWFVLMIDDDRERGGLVFKQYPIGSCYVASTRPDGQADTLYRAFKITAEQAVNDYGEDEVSDKLKQLAKDKPDELVEFVHCIYPRKTYAVDAKLGKNLPFASNHIEVASGKYVREGGFHEVPFVAPRWKRIATNSGYGVGPVLDALPDIRTLNELVRLELAAADLAVSGMYIAEDDGVLNPTTIRLGARKIIVANSVDSMKPLSSGSDFNVSFTIKADLQRAIRKILMADQLQPQDGPAMTATEVHARMNLIRQLLGPVYGRLQSEWLRPMIERCFGLAFRAGVFSAPPESLRDRNWMVKYESPMARAQKLETVTAIDNFEMALMTEANADPEVLDVYDWDAGARERGKLLGVPESLMRDAKDVKKLRKERGEAQQAAQQQAVVAEAQSAAAQQSGKTVAAA